MENNLNDPPGNGRRHVRRAQYIRHLADPSFKKHFRMSREVFERLIQAVGPPMRGHGLIQRERTPVSDSILMGLWILFNPDTYRSEGLNFQVSTNTVHTHYKRLIEALLLVGYRYIKWPSAVERQRTAIFYERQFGFPGVVGSVDGTHIEITAPSEQKQRYVNRHQKYSMNVQVVSDHRRLIRDVYAGQPGSVNDARVFKRSPLAKNLYGRHNMLSPDEHLVGDGAYVTTTKLLTPYRVFFLRRSTEKEMVGDLERSICGQ